MTAMTTDHRKPPRLRSIPPRGQGGSALLLVMWSMLLMSMAVFGVVQFVGYGLDETVMDQRNFRARQLAESGLAIGLHPRVRPGDPVLHQEISKDESIDVRIRPEDGRLPINEILLAGRTDALRFFFEQWGLETEAASILADSLADWVDRNGQPRLYGAENDYYADEGYPDYPRNRPFGALDEMLPVRGMDQLAAIRPDWRDFFTVYGSGKLNVNGAAADSIAFVTGVFLEQAQSLVETRNGPDAVADTEDDLRFRSLDEFRDALGMGPGEFAAVAPFLSVDSTVVRVESRGRAGNCTRTLSVIATMELPAGGGRRPGRAAAPAIIASMED